MRAAELDPQPRRLLRYIGRIDPNPTKIEPRNKAAAAELEELGFGEIVPMFGGKFEGIQITDAGRAAL